MNVFMSSILSFQQFKTHKSSQILHTGLQYHLCWCCTKQSEVVPIERLLVGGGDRGLRVEVLKIVDTEGAVSISS